jgi:hypothetical protein
MNLTTKTILCLAASAGMMLAQGMRGGNGQPGGMNGSAGSQNGTHTSNLAMTKLQTVTGAVTAVDIGYAMQYPTITINKLQVKVAPVWFLLDSNFEIKAGDSLSVVAAPSLLASDPYLYAVSITNTKTGAKITLRDANGFPVWAQGSGSGNMGSGGMGSGNGPGTMNGSGECTQLLSIATDSGLVQQISSGAHIQMPTLTLKTSAGKLLEIKLGPERILLNAGMELSAGDSITVKYAVTAHDDELIALAITKNGVTVTLRGEDCHPAWN